MAKKKAESMKNKPKVWLVRDNEGPVFDDYVFGFGKRPKRDGTVWVGDAEISPRLFERMTPKSCHLKPGEGPICINVTIKRVTNA